MNPTPALEVMESLRMRQTIIPLTVLLLAPLAALHAAETKPAKPNLVVILIDDMGYGDIGPFGSKTRTARPTSTGWPRKA